MTDTTVRGGCLCGVVRFVYIGPLGGDLGAATVCFCAQCRKAQGLGAAVAPALAAGFAISSGAETVTEYESSPGKLRAFCRVCGSPLYSRRSASPDLMRLRLGALDSVPAGLHIEAQIFTEGAPDWTAFGATPRYPGIEPGRS
jgi:hypothetical protein